MRIQDDLVDTDELRAFDAVATKRSFSIAASELGCSQSTISERITRLEQRLQRVLVLRTTRQVKLTPDGEAALIYARGILDIAEDARARLSRSRMAGILKIGIEDQLAATRLPPLLRMFGARFPHFGLRFVTGRNHRLQEALRMRDVDLIITKSHPDSGAEVLWREPLVWMARPDVAARRDGPVPVISYLGPSVLRDIVEARLVDHRRSFVTVAECSNFIGKVTLAEAGLGVIAVAGSNRNPGLIEVPDEVGLPSLGSLDFVLEGAPARHSEAIDGFREVLSAFATGMAGEMSGTDQLADIIEKAETGQP